MNDQQNPFQPPARPPVPGGAVQASSGPSPGGALDFGRALRFFFEDPDWVKKLLIGSLVLIAAMFVIPIVFLMGYYVRVIKRSAEGERLPLPEWDDWGELAVDGLKAFAIQIAYVLPVYIVMFVPIAIGAAMGEDSSIGALIAGLGFFLGILLVLVVSLTVPAALTRFAVSGDLASAFQVGEVFAFISRNIGNYLMAILLLFLANMIAQFGILAFCIGIFPASFWGMCVMGYGFGEVAYRDPGA